MSWDRNQCQRKYADALTLNNAHTPTRMSTHFEQVCYIFSRLGIWSCSKTLQRTAAAAGFEPLSIR